MATTGIGRTFHRPDITLMDLRLPGTNGTDESDLIRHGKAPALAKGSRKAAFARRSYRENVSMIASAIASAYSSSTKWPPSK